MCSAAAVWTRASMGWARARGVLGFALGLALALPPVSTVFAGPVEILEAVAISPSDPDVIVIRYRYAGGGVLVSRDGGKTFSFVCNSAIDVGVVAASTM